MLLFLPLASIAFPDATGGAPKWSYSSNVLEHLLRRRSLLEEIDLTGLCSNRATLLDQFADVEPTESTTVCTTPDVILTCVCEGGLLLADFEALQAGSTSPGYSSTVGKLCATRVCKFPIVTATFVYELQRANPKLATLSASDVTECICADPATAIPFITTGNVTSIASVPACQATHVAVTSSVLGNPASVSCPTDTASGGDPCFPGKATVTLANGTISRIDAIEKGDAILASTLEGKLTTGIVSSLSITKPWLESTFSKLKTAAGNELTLTPEHHIPVGAECCRTLKKAREVLVGEQVWGVRDGVLVAETVAETSAAIEKGLYSPVLTNGAFPVVDGMVTSFDSIEAVTIASYLLPYLEGLLDWMGVGSFLHSKRGTSPTEGSRQRATMGLDPPVLCDGGEYALEEARRRGDLTS